MRLIIVRHGRTFANAKGIHQGQMHGRLSPEGEKQAAQLGTILKNEPIDIIYSSDLGRAVSTTRHISKHHKAPVEYRKVLREIALGEFEGKPYEWVKLRTFKLNFRPKGGESYFDVVKRIRKFTKTLYSRHKNDTVLISTHGIVVKSLAHIYLKMSMKQVMSMYAANGGMLVLDVNGKTSRLIKNTVLKEKKL